jgi:hypothetical protein
MSVIITRRGPMFDGVAAALIKDWQRETMETVADAAQAEIQRRARAFRRSGRNTGRAAAAVHVYDKGSTWQVKGENTQGEVWWPWLEGESRRNFSTRFKGYHTFRIVKNIYRRKAKRIGTDLLQKYLPLMGGH